MEHSSYLSQLEALSLNFYAIDPAMNSVQYPKLTRLKKLNVYFIPWHTNNFFRFKPLLKECPFLQKIVLQLDDDLWDFNRKPSIRRKVRSHYHLKIVEIGGFDGHALSFEFAVYLLNISVSLQKIMVDPPMPSEKKEVLWSSDIAKEGGPKPSDFVHILNLGQIY